jgi:predicted dehydrogenase
MKTKEPPAKIRLGVLGAGRGRSFMTESLEKIGCQLVAVCDADEAKLDKIKQDLPGVRCFQDFDDFITYDMDAVVLANYFHQHAPFAIKALEAGKHVLSECVCNSTLAEGVALCRAVEKSGKIYMLAENYPYSVANQEMTRLYQSGVMGKVLYADGEYNHYESSRVFNILSPGVRHWRNIMPATYYCTHAMAPLMMATDTMPVKVTGYVTSADENVFRNTAKIHDVGSIIMCEMDNGALFRNYTAFGVPGTSIWYRYNCSNGGMETSRLNYSQVRIYKEPSCFPLDEVTESVYSPKFREYTDEANAAGHGGGDFYVCLDFIRAILENRQPWLDVYRGVALSSIGIIAWRSVLNGNIQMSMPDFRDEEQRKKIENDCYSPFLEKGDPFKLPSAVKRSPVPPEWIEAAKVDWKNAGLKF